MPNAEERMARAMQENAQSMKQMVRIMETMNQNVVKVGELFKSWLELGEDEVEDANQLAIPALVDQEAKNNLFEVDDIVQVTEKQNAWYGAEGTVIGIRRSGTIRVMLPGIEGYQQFIAEELTKIGEQPYKEK
jgi:hypothetical protein